jgi:hypothetical protein
MSVAAPRFLLYLCFVKDHGRATFDSRVFWQRKIEPFLQYPLAVRLRLTVFECSIDIR